MTADKKWKPLELIKVTAEYLATKDVPNPRVDAELLLCQSLGLSRRVDLYAGFEREISGKELASYRELIRRRAAREPVSRILGRREFMGLPFKVTPEVLSPRPETELLVEAALALYKPAKPAPEGVDQPELPEPGLEAVVLPDSFSKLLDSYGEDADDPDAVNQPSSPPPTREQSVGSQHPPERKKSQEPSDRYIRVLDLGTGSGCIAVSVAAMLPSARVTAVDASPGALTVARDNARRNGVADRVEFRQGDWFAGCRKGELYDLILSNPPYLVRDDAEIWPEVSEYDPAVALYGGQDGLDCYRRILPRVDEWLAPDGTVLMEVGAGQAPRVAEMLRSRGFQQVECITDYAGVERIVKASGLAET